MIHPLAHTRILGSSRQTRAPSSQLAVDKKLEVITAWLKRKYPIGGCTVHPTEHCFFNKLGHWILDAYKLLVWAIEIVSLSPCVLRQYSKTGNCRNVERPRERVPQSWIPRSMMTWPRCRKSLERPHPLATQLRPIRLRLWCPLWLPRCLTTHKPWRCRHLGHMDSIPFIPVLGGRHPRTGHLSPTSHPHIHTSPTTQLAPAAAAATTDLTTS